MRSPKVFEFEKSQNAQRQNLRTARLSGETAVGGKMTLGATLSC
jgi:hypothetical protein